MTYHCLLFLCIYEIGEKSRGAGSGKLPCFFLEIENLEVEETKTATCDLSDHPWRLGCPACGRIRWLSVPPFSVVWLFQVTETVLHVIQCIPQFLFLSRTFLNSGEGIRTPLLRPPHPHRSENQRKALQYRRLFSQSHPARK